MRRSLHAYPRSRPIPIVPVARRHAAAEGRNPRSLSSRARCAPPWIGWALRRGRDEHVPRAGFEYTLTPPLLDFDSVDDFIFNTKKSFCGHYASAFVTMMRAAGVPRARGHRLSRWRGGTGSDSTSWCGSPMHAREAEVWLDGRELDRFDPGGRGTSATHGWPRNSDSGVGFGERSADAAGHWLPDMRQRWDALNDWWNERVVKIRPGDPARHHEMDGVRGRRTGPCSAMRSRRD